MDLHRSGRTAHTPFAAFAAFAARQADNPLTEAFSRRDFVMPWSGCEPVPDAEAESTLARIFQTPRTEPAVAYIHVPYCQNHCLFCGFFQNVWRPEVSAAFVADVVAEMARLADTPLVGSAPIVAVYIGGGTPTVLASDDLARLIEGVRCHLPLSADYEITLEGRTYDFGIEKATAALNAGANRISLGVQSFDTRVRQRLGRKASSETARAFLAELVALDRAPVGCDLIYGLPGQDRAIWRADVETAIDLGLDGVSLYALNIWPGGPLAQAVDRGKIAPPGPLAFQAEAYGAAAGQLAAAGWRQVSQSHFAGAPRERNRYNRLVKSDVPCLAFGPGAGGQAHGHSWRNVIDVERRKALIADRHLPVERLARLPRNQRPRAIVAAGLDAGALDLAAIEHASPGFADDAAPLLANWSQAGLGAIASGYFRTTQAGAFWTNNLINGLHAVLDRMADLNARTAET